MLLQLQTWPEVERYLERSRGIVVPIGSTEQHGPNGLIGTDALCAEGIARGVGETAEAMVAPVIHVGIAQHHMGFSGSMTLKPSTLILVIKEWVESLAAHGFERFYFLNGHGGNVTTINASFQELYAARSLARGSNRPLRCSLRSWWMGERTRALIRERFGDKDGSHATISEVSVTQHLFPHAIKQAPDMGPPSEWRGGWHDAEDYRAKFPDGRIGSHPYLANPEDGKALYETAVAEIAEAYGKFMEER